MSETKEVDSNGFARRELGEDNAGELGSSGPVELPHGAPHEGSDDALDPKAHHDGALEGKEHCPKNPWISRLNLALDSSMKVQFYRLGYFIAKRPWTVIVAMIAIALVSLLGMLRFKVELRVEELYTPAGTKARSYRKYVSEHFTNDYRVSSILFRVKEEGGDLANKRTLLEIVNVTKLAFSVSSKQVATPPDGDGSPVKWEGLCIPGYDNEGKRLCLTISILDLFYEPDSALPGDGAAPDFFASVEDQISKMEDEDILKRLLKGPYKSWSGLPFVKDDVIVTSSESVTAVVFTAFLINRPKQTFSGRLVDKVGDSFDKEWMRALEKRNLDRSLSVTWHPTSHYDREKSIYDSVFKDMRFFPASFVLLTLYVSFALSELHPVYSRVGLGLCALANCGLALVFTFGVSSLIGWTYGTSHNILTLLLTGIGIDDIMVVTKCFAHVDREMERDPTGDAVPRKIARALSHSGVSIAATTSTNVVVFLVSAVSNLPGLRWFSLWASVGIAACFFYTITFYLAALTLDQRRIENGKKDIYLGYKPALNISTTNIFGMRFRSFSRFFQETFGPFVLRRSVKAILLFICVGITGVNIWGITRIYIDFEMWFLLMTGSSAWEFAKESTHTFRLTEPAHVYVRNVDFASSKVQLMMIELCDPINGAIARNKWVQNGSVSCWYATMRAVNGLNDNTQLFEEEEFITNVTKFLSMPPGIAFKDDFVLKSDGRIEAARFSYKRIHLDSNDELVDAMHEIRNQMKGYLSGEEVFSYGQSDLNTEQLAVMARDIALSLGLALGAVLLVCLVLSGHPLLAVICAILVLLIVIDTIGFCHFSGYNLNIVVVLTLTFAVGMGVDFVLHIARSFQEQVGDRKERAIMALHDLGPSVFHAGFSTVIAIIVPGTSRSYIFRAVFWVLFTMLMYAALHGLVFGPVLLSLLGPKGWFISTADKDREEEEIAQRAHRGKEEQDVKEESVS